MKLFGWFEKLINEHGSANILGQRITLLQEQLLAIVKDKEDLQKQNTELIKANSDLCEQIAEYKEVKQFVESHGALFKRKPEGGYSESPYCPRCRFPMAMILGHPYSCQPCKYYTSLRQNELGRIISELPNA